MICVPLRAKSEKELIALIKKAEKKGAQAVEIWLDHLVTGEEQRAGAKSSAGPAGEAGAAKSGADSVLTAIRKATKLPLIFVNKPKREKGKWTGTEHSRIEILKNAIAHGADYIDIGIDTDTKLIAGINTGFAKLILSYHNFTDTPRLATLKYIFKKMRVHKPDVYKFAVTPKNPKDVVRMLEFLGWIRAELGTGSSMRLDAGQGSKLGAGQIRAGYVIICMGRYGEFLRQISENLGNKFTYVALDEKHKTAPGQQTLQQTAQTVLP